MGSAILIYVIQEAMNLQEFINYRKDCPLCDSQLKLAFHSKRRQTHRYEDNRLLFVFDLNGLTNKQKNYKVGYSFGLEDNSYYIEFYSKNDQRFDNETPDFLRARFKEFNKNLLIYHYFKYCPRCRCYNYSSNSFNMMTTIYDKHNIGSLNVETEYIGMTKPALFGGYKIYKLHNNYTDNKSILMFGKHTNEFAAESDYIYNISQKLDMIETSIIKFTSKDETMCRLSKLILFS
jgi:hypothetical protein